MAAQHSTNTNFTSRYKFNGKELDQEIEVGDSRIPLKNNKKGNEQTGWYYYGARYYDPSISTWLSVDPLVEKYTSFSPYNYTLNNPIDLIDPEGKQVDDCCSFKELKEKYKYVKNRFLKLLIMQKSILFQKHLLNQVLAFLQELRVPLYSVDGGFVETKGNQYSWTIKKSSEITTTASDDKLHNYINTSAKIVDSRVSANGSVDVIVTPKDNPTDIADLFTGKIDRVERDISFGVSHSKNSGGNYNDVKLRKTKASTKISSGTKFLGVKTSIGAKFILGINVELKIGIEY